MANHGGNHSTQRRKDVLLKIYEGDEPELCVAEGDLGDAIADSLGLGFISTVDDGNDGDVAIGGGELMAVHVGKAKRISISLPELHRPRGRGPRNQEKEKPAEMVIVHASS